MFNEVCRRNVLTLANEYERATGRGPTVISMNFYGNGTFFRELYQRKRSISVERLGHMLAEFARCWPEGAPWPELEPIYFTRENMLQQRYAKNRAKK
jgi:hypothetical protein